MEVISGIKKFADIIEGLAATSSIASFLKLNSLSKVLGKGASVAGNATPTEKGGASGEKKIAADALNLGLDDENLYLGAIALAKNLGLISNDDIRNYIDQIFKLLSDKEAKRLRFIIGREESECVVRIPDGKGGFTDMKTTGNLRGALILQSFVGIPPADTVEMLKKSRMLTSAWDEVVELWGVTRKKLEDLEFQRGILNAIGYESLEALERSNADKARALQTRKNQFWMEWLWPWDKPGSVLYVVVVGLIAVGLIISFFAHAPK